MSLHLLKQHHGQFHKGKQFDETLYTRNTAHKNAKERKEIEKHIFEEQERREKARQKELKQLNQDLNSLKSELSTVLSTQITEISKERDENLKIMDNKMSTMQKIINDSLGDKSEHRKRVDSLENTQIQQYDGLKNHIDEVIFKYKQDLDARFSSRDVKKDKEKQELQAEISAKNNEIADSKKKFGELMMNLDKAQGVNREKQKEVKELESRIKAILEDKSKEGNNVKIIEDQLAVQTRRNEGLETENDKLKTDIKPLKEEVKKLKLQLSEDGKGSKEIIEDLEHQIKVKNNTINKQGRDVTDMKNQIRTKEQEIAKLKVGSAEKEQLLEKFKESQKELVLMKRELTETKKELANLKRKTPTVSQIVEPKVVPQHISDKDPSNDKVKNKSEEIDIEDVKSKIEDILRRNTTFNLPHPDYKDDYKTRLRHKYTDFRDNIEEVKGDIEQFELDIIQKHAEFSHPVKLEDLNLEGLESVRTGVNTDLKRKERESLEKQVNDKMNSKVSKNDARKKKEELLKKDKNDRDKKKQKERNQKEDEDKEVRDKPVKSNRTDRSKKVVLGA